MLTQHRANPFPVLLVTMIGVVFLPQNDNKYPRLMHSRYNSPDEKAIQTLSKNKVS